MDLQELDALESKLERLVIEHCFKIKEENKKLKEENGNQKQIIEMLHNLKKENERLKRVKDIMDGVIRRKWGLV